MEAARDGSAPRFPQRRGWPNVSEVERGARWVFFGSVRVRRAGLWVCVSQTESLVAAHDAVVMRLVFRVVCA